MYEVATEVKRRRPKPEARSPKPEARSPKPEALSERDRLLLEEVRRMLQGAVAAVSLDVEERVAALERVVKQVPRMVWRRRNKEVGSDDSSL